MESSKHLSLSISIKLPDSNQLERLTTLGPKEIYHQLTDIELKEEILLKQEINVDPSTWIQKQVENYHFFEFPKVQEFTPITIQFN